MIAIALSLIMGAAVVRCTVASKNTYRFQESLSAIQENGRFAVNYITEDVRSAGLLGCGNIDAIAGQYRQKCRYQQRCRIDERQRCALYTGAAVIRGYDNVAAGITARWPAPMC